MLASRVLRAVRSCPVVALTSVDLFCGAGGLSAGLRRAGFDVLGAVDAHPVACRAYRANHPQTTVWERDIRRLDPREMRDALGLARGGLDLLAGCPPCQGFSTLRTLNGRQPAADRRNSLVSQIGRFAEEFRPRAVMMENVPALARDPRSARIRRLLEKLGYSVVEDTMDAAAFGVPQRRRRYILIALRDGTPQLARAAARTRTVRELIASLPPAGSSGDPLHDHGERRSVEVRDLIAAIPKNGGSRGELPPERQLACHRKVKGFHDVYGRMAWDRPAPTITGGCVNPSKGRFLHPVANRSITLREAALLQTFPPSYGLPLNDGPGSGKFAIAELIGNALPPEFVYRHALAIGRSIAGWDVGH